MYIKVKVHAGENKNILLRKSPDSCEVWVKAPAERRLANQAVAQMLAKELSIDSKKLRLIKGATSPSKIFEY